MQQVKGVRAVVQGDLPQEIMDRIAASVRRAVLLELAEVDLGPHLHQLPLQPTRPAGGEDLGAEDLFPPILLPIVAGLWLQPVQFPQLPDIDGTSTGPVAGPADVVVEP